MQQALHWRPDAAELHDDLGLAYLQQDRCAEAERHFHRAAELKPDSAEMHNNLGVALARQKKQDEAVNCFRQALRLEPRYVEAHTNLGFVLRRPGRARSGAGQLPRSSAAQTGFYGSAQ